MPLAFADDEAGREKLTFLGILELLLLEFVGGWKAKVGKSG